MSRSSIRLRLVEVAWNDGDHDEPQRADTPAGEGQRYRSLTVIAEQITGAHWSGPRFFGVTRRARASLPDAG